MLKAVVAERLSFTVEMYGLLPANYSGAKKKKSAEQTSLPQKRILEPLWHEKEAAKSPESLDH